MIKAIYGKITFNQHTCPSCGNSLLNQSQYYFCDVCNYSNEDEKAKIYKIIVPPPGLRKYPSIEIQRKLLKKQNSECYWCGRKFNIPYWRNNKIRYLTIHWDHKNPFSFEQTNRDKNWAASCSICNRWKHNFMFKKEKDCRRFLLGKWQRAINDENISFIVTEKETAKEIIENLCINKQLLLDFNEKKAGIKQ